MKFQLTALLTALAVLGCAGIAVRANEQMVSLGDIHTFEVHQFEKEDFSAGREKVPPEIVEYARTAIQNDERLLYRSPGEGIVHLYCDSPQCGRIRMEVTQGVDGPVVWKTSRQFRAPIVFVEPDSRKFAKKLVNELATDYELAIKETPATIPIKE
jgi:hypothetical protein